MLQYLCKNHSIFGSNSNKKVRLIIKIFKQKNSIIRCWKHKEKCCRFSGNRIFIQYIICSGIILLKMWFILSELMNTIQFAHFLIVDKIFIFLEKIAPDSEVQYNFNDIGKSINIYWRFPSNTKLSIFTLIIGRLTCKINYW